MDPIRRHLHELREQIGLTVYDIVDITGLSYGTVLYNFWSGRSKAGVHPEIRNLIESRHADWLLPENIERRERLASMSMEQIVREWSEMLDVNPDADLRTRALIVADALGVHELTVERQIDGKRDRWNLIRIFSYEQDIKKRASATRARILAVSPMSDKSSQGAKAGPPAAPTLRFPAKTIHPPKDES